jgi:hypothetical protein
MRWGWGSSVSNQHSGRAPCIAVLTDLPLATGHGDVDEAAGVSEPLLGAALGGLLLLLGLNLFPLRQRSVPVRVLVPLWGLRSSGGRELRFMVAGGTCGGERVGLPWLQHVSLRCIWLSERGYIRV